MDDVYRNWEDFLDTEPAPTETGDKVAEAPDIRELFDRSDVPEEVKRLLRHHQKLERQLKRSSGMSVDEEDDPDSRRKELAYPVFVHTKQARIAQRRQRRARERMEMREKRRLEGILCERKRVIRAEAERVESKAQRERRLREARLAEKRRIQQERIEAQRARLEEKLRLRWLFARERAIRQTALRRRQEQRLHEERLYGIREKLTRNRIQQRQEVVADERRRQKALKQLREKRSEFARFF